VPEDWDRSDRIPFPITPHPQTPAADVLLALSKYDDTLQLLRDASQRPVSRFPINYDAPGFSISLMHLSKLKVAAIYLHLLTAAQLESGQTEAAASNVNLMFCVADSVKTEPFLISYLVRASILQINLSAVWEGMSKHRWSAEELKTFQEKLQSMDMLADYVMAMQGERSCDFRVIDDVTTRRLAMINSLGLLTDEEM
jgi:hypothetical protein